MLRFYCTLQTSEGEVTCFRLSRLCQPNNNNDKDDVQNSQNSEEAYLDFITNHAMPCHFKKLKKNISFEDHEVRDTRRALKSGERHDQIKIEFTENNGIILRDSRIYITTSLLNKVLKIVHEGESGSTKSKALLRENMYWPNMDRDKFFSI